MNLKPLNYVIYPVSTDGQRHAIGWDVLGGDGRDKEHQSGGEFHHGDPLNRAQAAIVKCSISVGNLATGERLHGG